MSDVTSFNIRAAEFGTVFPAQAVESRNTVIRIAGELAVWPSKSELASILRAAGLSVTVGRYSIRVDDCDHFAFQEYGGAIGGPCIDADAASLEQMLQDARRVSDAMSAANIRHRFELYDEADALVGYLHHEWPSGT